MLRAAILLSVLAFLYLYGLGGYGVVGPDEPRYAAIGHAMAQTGDWITPRLWSEPWFEKPALLYWMIAAADTAGLRAEWAARLPVAVLSLAFLVFFLFVLRREFGRETAFLATGILATSAGWLAFSNAGVTDLPLSAMLGAALWTLAPWDPPNPRRATVAGVFLGLAVLAKGLVPLVLFLPAFWAARRILLYLLAGALVAAAPWYALCYAANGWTFVDDFFLKHHFARFFEPSLQHVQPIWFYIPVLLGALFPWSLALFSARPERYDPRIRFLVVFTLFGFLFFSFSKNKLPGYILPLMPGLATLAARALLRTTHPHRWLAAATGLLCIEPAVRAILPEALLSGLSRTTVEPARVLPGLAYLVPAAAIWALGPRLRLNFSIAFSAAVVAWMLLKAGLGPELDRSTTVRPYWRSVQTVESQLCLDQVRRPWVYGLNYYAGRALPECGASGGSITVTDQKIRSFQKGER